MLTALVSGREPRGFGVQAWKKLPKAAAVNQLAGVVYGLVKPTGLAPADILAELKLHYQVGAGAVILSEQAMINATRVLSEAGLEYLPLKGAVFRHLLYDDSSLRPAVDIDILVKSKDYDEASRAMDKAGYERLLDNDNRPVSMENCYERSYLHPDIKGFGALIEIHNGFAQDDRYRPAYQQIWERALTPPEMLERICRRASTISELPFGDGARLLDPEDTLTHLFIHAAMHMFHLPLRSFVDMKLLIERWNPDWVKLTDRVGQAGVRGGAYLCLDICRKLFDTKVPDHVMMTLEPGSLRKVWLETFVSTQPVPWSADDSLPLSFFLLPVGLRFQQVLIGLPLIDNPTRAMRFAASYLALRGRDAVAAIRHKYSHLL
ncbi:nucleotidyltransferase family protein [Myxococcota bacterium]